MQIALISTTSGARILVVRLARENHKFALQNMVISCKRYTNGTFHLRSLVQVICIVTQEYRHDKTVLFD